MPKQTSLFNRAKDFPLTSGNTWKKREKGKRKMIDVCSDELQNYVFQFSLTFFWLNNYLWLSSNGIGHFSLDILKITWFWWSNNHEKIMKVGGCKNDSSSFFRFVPSPLQSLREKCHNYYLPHPLISKWFLKILPLVLLSAFHSCTIKSVWNVVEFGQKTRAFQYIATGGAVICIHFWFWQLLS